MADYYQPLSPNEERAELESLIKAAKERLDKAQIELEMAEEDLSGLEEEWRGYR